jgi:CDP-diacylglycerol--glycerol-3-phosphate 3-phosphatidyltransferase
MTISAAAPERKPSPAPTILTALRAAAGPIVAALILAADNPALASGAGGAAVIWGWACALFALAALTDAIDGPLARRLNAVTPFGAALDHAADKVLLACTLIALAATALSRDLAFAAVLLVGRDLLIGGVREGLAHAGRKIPVAQLGKVKTALAFVGVGAAMLVQPLALAQVGVEALPALFWIAGISLWGAAAAAVVSGALYLRAAVRP